jgi:hypothetical protein
MHTRRVFVAIVVAWAAFAYRFSAPYFHNDHFEHLSMARQMLFGEWPMRDFIDPGRPLTVALSALGQWIAPNLLSEAILTMGALAIGAALTFWLASLAARSTLLGLAAAAVVIAILPRLYSYPKIVAFPLMLWALWRYVDVSSVGRLIALAATVVFAFLLRYDFGVYAGVASAAVVLVTPRPVAIRKSVLYAVIGMVLVAPYVAWLASIGRLGGTGSSGIGKTADMVTGGDFARPVPRIDLSHGVVHIDPRVADVTVRWSPRADAAARQAAEEKHGLIDGVEQGGGTFAYGLTDASGRNVHDLVNDPIVDDTGGIDRRTLVIDAPWFDRVIRRLPTSRVVWGPFFDVEGASVWLYYFVWAMPLLALLRLAWKAGLKAGLYRPAAKRPRPSTAGGASVFEHEGKKIGGAALLGILMNLYLIRGSFDSRLSDVIVPAAVVGAWLCREYLDWLRRRRSALMQWGLASAGVIIATFFWASLTTMESTASIARLATAAFRVAPLKKAAAELAQRPLDFYAPPNENGIKRLTRYVHDCLVPEDRLLLVAYEPQVFYYSERLFAGGMEYFHQGRFSSPQELANTVARLSRQRVPMIIIEQTRQTMFQEDYRPVFEYVAARYHHAATATFVDNRTWEVLAENSRPVVSTREDGLPCFR